MYVNLLSYLFINVGALKVNPSNALHTLWYAKLLRKKGKIPQAEVMYQVAIKNSSKTSVSEYTISNNSVEASAICNYATFIYKQKKNPQKALNLFENGLKKFMTHKGLIKNYLHLLKENPNLVGNPEVLAVVQSKHKKGNSFRVIK
jgi:tetratricopeptide (TPR) repeat protein